VRRKFDITCPLFIVYSFLHTSINYLKYTVLTKLNILFPSFVVYSSLNTCTDYTTCIPRRKICVFRPSFIVYSFLNTGTEYTTYLMVCKTCVFRPSFIVYSFLNICIYYITYLILCETGLHCAFKKYTLYNHLANLDLIQLNAFLIVYLSYAVGLPISYTMEFKSLTSFIYYKIISCWYVNLSVNDYIVLDYSKTISTILPVLS